MKNGTTSVSYTPHNPLIVEINEVTAINAITTTNAVVLSTRRISIRIFTIAKFTHPSTIQLMGKPKYNARKPRKNAAGLPAYRISLNSISIVTPLRRRNRV